MAVCYAKRACSVYALNVQFTQCAAGTVGIEWEVQVIDPESRDLIGRAPDLIARIDDPRIKGEFFTNTIELVSGVHPGVDSAMTEMRELRDLALRHADKLGVALVGMGVHPFAQWKDQELADSDRYRRVVAKSGEWGQRQIMIGVHTHVGVGDGDAALEIQNHLLTELPLILALSSSSPFWQGRDAGVASQRSMIFQQLPNAALPPRLGSWQEYTELVDELLEIDAISDISELRWAVRPAPEFGTIEARIADGAPSLTDLAAINALTVTMIERIARRVREDDAPRLPAEWKLNENRWRAIRYGLDARIALGFGETRPVVALLEEAIDELEPVAAEIGAEESFSHIETILREGNSTQRQRRTGSTGNADVVDLLVQEFRS